MEARRATADDIDELIRLRQVMFDSMAGVMDQSGGWQEPCVEVFRRGIADGSLGVFVVDAPEGGGGLAACGVALVGARLPGPGNLTGRYGYVQSMATDERWRRRGFGRAVFGALVEWFASEGITAIDLHATDDGEALYRSFGFREGETVELRWRARWEHSPGRRLDQLR
jgi:GNAT superfamily N-acetyltransferase